MNNFNQDKQEELIYLEKTLKAIKDELYKEKEMLDSKISNVIKAGREMWNESAHFSEDFDNVPEMNQYLLEANERVRDYSITQRNIEKYDKMLKNPYFGRFDFAEDGFNDIDNVYIGSYNLVDKNTDEILIYDWRAPVSSMFYRCEVGKASYKSPIGTISGDMLLKKQYKIQDSKLKYFFDSSIKVNDEILQEVLSENASSKMKTIVETIQKEQDIIIRDTDNELLIVQGVAGSGKTSIALHRIAYLLYQGLNSKLSANNIIIVSPNSIFSKYISEVLPELGEENVEEITFDEIITGNLGKSFLLEHRKEQLEALILTQDNEDFNIRMGSIQFKGSIAFTAIINRLIEYYEKKLIDFKDVYYDGETIETREELKNFFLNNKINIPIAKRLRRIEGMILNKIHSLRKKRLNKIEKVVESCGNHILEIKSFSRLMAIKESKILMNHLHSFTQIDYMDLYKLLFNKEDLLLKLSDGLELPKDINKIISETKNNLNKGKIYYEDCVALLYIKLKLDGNDDFSQIKQVLIDEAQDYYPLQYQVFNLLFKRARYTVLGDFNQTIDKYGDNQIYTEIEKVLDKKKSVKLSMNKSYRSSIEISSFNKRLLNNEQKFIPFERHEAEPLIIYKESHGLMYKSISEDIAKYHEQGYKSIAIICKTEKEAEEVQGRLENVTYGKVVNNINDAIGNYMVVIPAYLAKGLEFDVVIVYDVSDNNYRSQFDKRLLYVACTRPLHQLVLYYTGGKSRFI
jgi:DNA helicase-2/ATP-dependent DNA helicase PcrA